MRVVAGAHVHQEVDPVTRWRRVTLIRAGYPPKVARELADRPDVDLHRAVELVAAGCDVTTALKILR